MKRALKEEAINMRKAGYSYSIIRHQLSVSKSTLSDWLRDIPYLPNEKTRAHIQAGMLRSAIAKNKQKIDSLALAVKEASS